MFLRFSRNISRCLRVPSVNNGINLWVSTFSIPAISMQRVSASSSSPSRFFCSAQAPSRDSLTSSLCSQRTMLSSGSPLGLCLRASQW